MKLGAKKTSLKRSGRLHKLGSRLWKSKSSKAKSGNKRRNVESRQRRRKRRRKKPSLLPIERRSRQLKRKNDYCNCNWRTLETRIRLMMKVPKKSRHKRLPRPIARCFLKMGAPGHQRVLLQQYQLRLRPNLLRVHHQLQFSPLLQHQLCPYHLLQPPLPLPTTLIAKIPSSRR